MKKENKLNSAMKLKGKYKIKTYQAPRNWLERFLIEKGVKKRKLLRESDEIKNLVVLNDNPSGLYIVLSRMIGNLDYDLEITECKIGNDDTAPTIADTDLGNVLVEDIPPATKSREADDEILITFFINDSEMPDDDYKEFGLFANEQMFARSIISPTYTKSTGEDTEIQYTITAEATA